MRDTGWLEGKRDCGFRVIWRLDLQGLFGGTGFY